MTALTQAQHDRIREAVDTAGVGHFTFAWAEATDADRKLAVVTVFASNGELHTAVAGTVDNSNWLTNEEQFANVLKRALGLLGRP